MKPLSSAVTLPLALLLLGAAAAQARSGFYDFGTNPNLATEWTKYVSIPSDTVTFAWNGTDKDLDVVKPRGQGGAGLYCTGDTRSPADPVTLTVKSLSLTSGAWGFLGLMISAVPQPGYVSTYDDSYTLRLRPYGWPACRFEVARTYLDGTDSYLLYTGPEQPYAGPYVLGIERVGADYVFKVNGATLYTTGTAAGDFYDTAAKDALVYYQIVAAGEIDMAATVDDFGVPVAVTNVAVTLDGSVTGDSIASNAPAGTRVGRLSMVNTNRAGFAYALDAGGDTTHFDIPAGTSNLVIRSPLGAGPYTLKIVGAKPGFAVTNAFRIAVTAPMTVSLSGTFTTNTAAGVQIGTLNMVNAASQDGFAYALDARGDTTHFAIRDTSKLLTAAPLAAGSYEIVIMATHAADGFWVTNAFTITVIAPDPALLPSSRHTPVIISEIMYHPRGRGDGLSGEFVELYNTQLLDIDVGGWRLTGEIDYTFPPGTWLGGRRGLLVAQDPAAYREISNVLGPYAGALDNAGGTVRLRNRQGALLLEAAYSGAPPWPAAADGAGHSLTLARPDYGESDVRAWAASSTIGGTPNRPDANVRHGYEGVVINEFLAHTDPPLLDAIELFNASSAGVDLSGCWLSDSAATNRFRIPDGTVIGPRGFLVYSNQLGFALSMSGGGIYLVSANQAAVVNGVTYPAQANAVSCGRYPDGMPGLQPLSARTLGARNAPPLARDVVINELMYHPISGYERDQYIELHNRGVAAIGVGGWRFTDGVDFTIPAGTVIPPAGYLVIAANLTNLLARYPQLSAANAVGDFGGSLSFRGERLVLSRPEDPDLPFQDFVTVDEVTYADGWGRWTDGGGSSLELRDPRSDNQLGMNWAGSDETQKAPWTVVDYMDEVSNGSAELNGTSPYTSPFEVVALMAGEYVVDDIAMTSGSTTYFSDGFEAGTSGWTFRGSHHRSSVEAGQGHAGSAGLHIRSSDRGEFSGYYPFFENHAQKNMLTAPQPGAVARIQAKVRWLGGFPYLLMGCRGYWCATPGELVVPANLGSPGLRNSRYAGNAGPAIADVLHSPTLPPAGSSVVVTCRIHDPDGIGPVLLKYRVDPSYATNAIAMRDDGAGADGVAGDGIYTGVLPGQSSGALVAFVIDAADRTATPATSRYPSKVVPPGAPAPECLVGWGLTTANGIGMPTHRILVTAANRGILSTLGYTSKQLVDCTYIYGNRRAVYAADVRERGNAKASGYVVKLPKENRVLGSDEMTVLTSGGHYRVSYLPWLCREVGEPAGCAVPIAFAFGTGALTFLSDWLPPSTELCGNWFGDADPEVFKNLDYSVDAFGMITNRFGMKKTRYAALSVKRAMLHPNDDYAQVFKLARAANTTGNAEYIKRVEAVVNVRGWASYFALAGLFGDWDKYGYAYSHNYYVYIPRHDRAQLLLHDLDLAFASIGVQWPTGNTVPNRMFVNTPAFKRVYWSVLKDVADGPMLPQRSDVYFDRIRDTGIMNGLDLGDPATFKQGVATARAAVLAGLAAIEAPFAITTQGGADFAARINPVTLSGTAPVHVEAIRINGHDYAVDYPTLTGWELRVWLQPGANALDVVGYDHAGAVVGRDSTTVSYAGQEIVPDGRLVINEIMYHPAVPYASYVELRNLSTDTLNLGGLRIEGIDADIGYGNMIGPTGFVVIAGSLAGYQGAYTNAEAVVGAFNGTLDNRGETLRLLRPTGSSEWVEIDRVTYGNDLPWPRAADGGGCALQLVDGTRDNNRVGNWAVDRTRPFTPGRPNSVSASLPAFPTVWINEVMPTNRAAGGITDSAGDHDPWIELYNADGGAVDLGAGGFYLSHSYTNLTAWAFPAGAVVTNGSRLLVWADGEPGEGKLHTSFRLDGGAGCVVLAWVNGGRTTVVDAVSYGLLNGASSYGSYPEGDPFSRQVFYVPTPGVSNVALSGAPPVFINEWLADNKSTLADPSDGNFDDWFELYNAGPERIDLAGYRLNDRLHPTNSVVIPGGASIEAGGFLLVWADEQLGWVGTNLHVNLRLSAEGEAIALFLPDGTLVDAVTFGPQRADVGEGRWPDGQSAIQELPIPTPGAPNRLFAVTSLRLAIVDTNRLATIIWNTRRGRRYRVEYTDVLGPGTVWSPCGEDVTANGTWFRTNILTGASVSNRFLRIRQL